MKTTRILLLLLMLISVGCAQKKINDNIQIDWDLTYKSILDKENEDDKWLWNWLGFYGGSIQKDPDQYISPIAKKLNSLPTNTILSSFLLEGPAPHAGEHSTIWAIETQGSIVLYMYGENELLFKTSKVSKEQYKILFNLLLEIQHKKPTILKDFELLGYHPGYIAFVSVFTGKKSWQLKISYEDYMGKDKILIKYYDLLKEIKDTVN